MEDLEQVRAYVRAYEWGGPTSSLQLHHMHELSFMIRPGDTVVDLACGPGPLLLELAPIYPETTFIGVDLSPTMLDHLRQQAVARKLANISVFQEDIRTLPSLDAKVDMVISTSALHHLPDDESLRQVFRRIRTVLKPDGGFYLFDFGLLKSQRTRELLVAEVAKLAPPVTAHDYDLSLRAAFPIDLVLTMAKEELPRPYRYSASSFFDFFFFLQTPHRTTPPARVQSRLDEVRRRLSYAMRIEYQMLRWMRRQGTVG